MLVSAFTARELTLATYQYAIDERCRFFSFGDAMFVKETCEKLLGVWDKVKITFILSINPNK